jgi:hypothetical protein
MAFNVAQWMAKGGSHHNYYMYYGGNHIESWAASSITNRYGDGSNLHSDTLSNEPKRSHLAAMYVYSHHHRIIGISQILVSARVGILDLSCSATPGSSRSPHQLWDDIYNVTL